MPLILVVISAMIWEKKNWAHGLHIRELPHIGINNITGGANGKEFHLKRTSISLSKKEVLSEDEE